LPQLLEIALRRAYAQRGIALTGFAPRTRAAPTLSDLIEACEGLVRDVGYSGEVRDNVDAALRARLGSFVAGVKGAMLDTSEPFDTARLLERDAVVNLDMVGDDQERGFLIGLLLVRLWEHRRGQRSLRLQHVTVLEEAHRVLGVRPAPALDGSPPGDFAATTFDDLLAEVRAAGESLWVVDQSPHRLSPAALANTALKVAFRTTLGADKDALAAAMNLDEAQAARLAGLESHTAIVTWEGVDRALLGMMRHRFVASGAPPAPRRIRRAEAPAVADPRLNLIADVLVRSPEDEAARLRDVLHAHAEAMLPDREATQAPAVADAAEQAATRRALRARGASAGAPREVLLDGRRPLAACARVCGTGGCLVGELVRPMADGARADGTARRWAATTSGGAANEIEHVAAVALGELEAPTVRRVATRCLAVQALDRVAVSTQLADILTALE
jgi:hypothetical protein